MDKKKETFTYTYSAKERAEVENIRKKYLPKEDDKMAQLRKLDSIPTQKAQAISLCFGVIGALIMGTGMSLAMTDLGASMGAFALVLGIVIGVIGMTLMALAYPMYKRVLKKEQERIAPEILRLTEELMK